jgi:hypothetical protein
MQLPNSLLKAIVLGVGVSTLAPSCSLYDSLEEKIEEKIEERNQENTPRLEFGVDPYDCPACGMG